MKNTCIITKISIAFMAVLSVFSLIFAIYRQNPAGASEAAVREIVRIVGGEMAAARSRDDAHLAAFYDSGEEYDGGAGQVDFRILSVTDEVVSFVVEKDLPYSSPYGRTVYYNVSQSSGEHITLSDVFGDGWKDIVTARIIPAIEADSQVYSGIDAAPMINENRMFYMDGDAVVIVFDTGEVAPEEFGVKIYPIST